MARKQNSGLQCQKCILHRTSDQMTSALYHVFGIGINTGDFHYIGWTQKSLGEESEQIYSDLVENSRNDIAHWVKEIVQSDKINIFEIESVPSIEEARSSAKFWCQYFHSLGLDVVTD